MYSFLVFAIAAFLKSKRSELTQSKTLWHARNGNWARFSQVIGSTFLPLSQGFPVVFRIEKGKKKKKPRDQGTTFQLAEKVMYNKYVQTKPHIKMPRIERNVIVNKIVISKNYLATKK